jgi:PadR family transcriptional regulator PadR
MANKKNDILQGTLGLLVLKILASGRKMHGYAITSHIKRLSAELLRVEEGSLYPALHRMEQDGWLRAEWGTTEKNRDARFYSLTPKGHKQLAEEQQSWNRITRGVARVMRAQEAD